MLPTISPTNLIDWYLCEYDLFASKFPSMGGSSGKDVSGTSIHWPLQFGPFLSL